MSLMTSVPKLLCDAPDEVVREAIEMAMGRKLGFVERLTTFGARNNIFPGYPLDAHGRSEVASMLGYDPRLVFAVSKTLGADPFFLVVLKPGPGQYNWVVFDSYGNDRTEIIAWVKSARGTALHTVDSLAERGVAASVKRGGMI